MDATKHKAAGNWANVAFQSKDHERHPVVTVSWRDARACVAWLNGQIGR